VYFRASLCLRSLAKELAEAARLAGIDVHKKMLAVVVADFEIESEYQFERRMFGSNPEQLRMRAAWLLEQEAEEVENVYHGGWHTLALV
jgi:hypothetical protein